MKKIMILLAIFTLVLSGCKTDPEGPPTACAPETEEDIRSRILSPYPAYYEKYTELVEQYGRGELVDKAKVKGGSYLSGVCVVNLMDFDADGVEDLFVVYHNGKLTGENMEGAGIPQANSYEIQVWTCIEGEIQQLLHEPQVGWFSSFITDYWDEDNCFVTVFENDAGVPVIQLYDETEYSCSYTNIYYDGNNLVKDQLSYYDNKFEMNGSGITEELWNENITSYDKILCGIYLSSPDYGAADLRIGHGIDYDTILDQTESVVSALSMSQPAGYEPAARHYASLYLRELDDQNRYRLNQDSFSYPMSYSLYDLNQDEIPELITLTGNCEAAYIYSVYMVVDDELVLCGELPRGHSGLMFNGLGTMVLYCAHMNSYEISKVTLEGSDLKTEIIASGNTDGSYPELGEIGLEGYDKMMVNSYGVLPFLLYAAAKEQAVYPLVLTPTAEGIESVYYSEGFFCINTGSKFGFMNKNGEEITSYTYDYAYPFHEGLACVMQDGKYGFIDRTGKAKLPFIYDRANSFSEGLAYFEIGDTYGFINPDGEEVFLLDCDSISSFREERAFFSIDGKYGYINPAGDQVIPAVYDDVHYFNRGLAMVRKGAYIGAINSAGTEVISLEYDTMQFRNSDIRVTRDGIESFFDYSGRIILPSDDQEEQLGEPVYDTVISINDGSLFIVCRDSKFGILDYNGEIQVPLQYEYIYNPHSTDRDVKYLNVRHNGKYGILRLDDMTETVSLIYERIYAGHKNYAIVQDSGGFGLIDENGDIMISSGQYNHIYAISDLTVCLEKNDKYYLARYSGELLSDKYYDYISPYANSGIFHMFAKDGKEGLLDPYGNEVLSASYDRLDDLDETRYRLENCLIPKNDDTLIKNDIIILGDFNDVDLSDVILTNEITPRLEGYHEYIQTGIKEFAASHLDISENTVYLDNVITLKFYDIDGVSKPVLYVCIRPVNTYGRLESASAFYYLENNRVKELVAGTEYGGSGRGDRVQLYLEKETGKTITGLWGIHGGSATIHDYIYLEEDKVIKNNRVSWTGKLSGYFEYSDDYRLEHAGLFYNDGIPFSQENILEAQYLEVYSMNDELISMEDYVKEVKKHIFVPMYMHD